MPTPDVSVIVPTRARPQSLRSCLAALATQGPPLPAFEVVVVDDGSPTPLDRQSFPSEMALRCLVQPPMGPAAARNRGARAASGRTLVFLDDDKFPEPGWLAELARQVEAHPGDAVGGRVLNAISQNVFSCHGQLLHDYLYAHYNPDPERGRFLASGNLAVPVEAFWQLGGFPEHYSRAAAEDRDFCHRWLASGRTLRYAPKAVVWHAHAFTLASFLRQHYGYGRGARRFHKFRAVGPEPAGFYLGLLGLPLTIRPWSAAARMGAATLLSQLAHGLGYVAEAMARPMAGDPDSR